MAATGTARGKKRQLSREIAIEILQSMPMLVAVSDTDIPIGTITTLPYEVSFEGASYSFTEQPFAVVRKITRSEYIAALPPHLRISGGPKSKSEYYYEIHTD